MECASAPSTDPPSAVASYVKSHHTTTIPKRCSIQQAAAKLSYSHFCAFFYTPQRRVDVFVANSSSRDASDRVRIAGLRALASSPKTHVDEFMQCLGETPSLEEEEGAMRCVSDSALGRGPWDLLAQRRVKRRGSGDCGFILRAQSQRQ